MAGKEAPLTDTRYMDSRYVQSSSGGLYLRPADRPVAAPEVCSQGCSVLETINDAEALLTANPGGAFAPDVLDSGLKEVAVARAAWHRVSEGCPGCNAEAGCPRVDRFSRVMRAVMEPSRTPMSSRQGSGSILQQLNVNNHN